MSSNPVTGALYLVRGIGLLTRPGLRRYVLLPLAVNILVFAAAIGLGMTGFEWLMGRMQAGLPGWLGWLEWLLWPVFVLAALIIVFYNFTLVANLLAAPFNGLLAEQAERLLTGRPPAPGDWHTLLRDTPGALWDELRKLMYALLWAVPFLLAALTLPVVGPLLWFLFIAWMLAIEYADYPLGNHGLKAREIRAALRRRRLLSLGFGAATAALTMTPLINFVAMPAAVAGATLMSIRESLHSSGTP